MKEKTKLHFAAKTNYLIHLGAVKQALINIDEAVTELKLSDGYVNIQVTQSIFNEKTGEEITISQELVSEPFAYSSSSYVVSFFDIRLPIETVSASMLSTQGDIEVFVGGSIIQIPFYAISSIHSETLDIDVNLGDFTNNIVAYDSYLLADFVKETQRLKASVEMYYFTMHGNKVS